jgi:hypothetical protein
MAPPAAGEACKALVASAYAARIARRAAEYGVVIGGDIGIDMRRVKARKDAIVAASRSHILHSPPSSLLAGNGRSRNSIAR